MLHLFNDSVSLAYFADIDTSNSRDNFHQEVDWDQAETENVFLIIIHLLK